MRFQIGDGKNEADLTYVDNTVHGHILAAEGLLRALRDGEATSLDTRVEGEAFTITNDKHPNFWDFARQMGAVAGYPTDPKRIISIPKSIGLRIALINEWLVWILSFGTRTPKVKATDLNYSTITGTFHIAKAKQRLGYRPIFSIEEGMKLAVAPLLAHDKKEYVDQIRGIRFFKRMDV